MNQNDFWSIRDANIKNLIVIPFQRRFRGGGQSRLIYLNLCRFTYVPIIREHRLSSNEKITQYIGWTPYVCISPSKWTIVKWRGIVQHKRQNFWNTLHNHFCTSQNLVSPERSVTPHRCLPRYPASFREQSHGNLGENFYQPVNFFCSSYLFFNVTAAEPGPPVLVTLLFSRFHGKTGFF